LTAEATNFVENKGAVETKPSNFDGFALFLPAGAHLLRCDVPFSSHIIREEGRNLRRIKRP
jgi:hypothetical protein